MHAENPKFVVVDKKIKTEHLKKANVIKLYVYDLRVRGCVRTYYK